MRLEITHQTLKIYDSGPLKGKRVTWSLRTVVASISGTQTGVSSSLLSGG